MKIEESIDISAKPKNVNLSPSNRRKNELAPIKEDVPSIEDRNDPSSHSEDLKKQVNGALDILNKVVKEKGLKFILHEGTNRIMVQIIETETEEIIKELPPKEVLDLQAKIKLMIGTIVDALI